MALRAASQRLLTASDCLLGIAVSPSRSGSFRLCRPPPSEKESPISRLLLLGAEKLSPQDIFLRRSRLGEHAATICPAETQT
jgi:hypothetical protein